jgi:hypothetical protein
VEGSPGRSPSAAHNGSDPADWLFWSAVWLAAVLIGVKAYYLATRTDPALVDLGLDTSSLAAISYRDVAFALMVWALARAAMLLVRRHGAAMRVMAALFIVVATISCLYAIASVVAFGILGGFLTWALLQLVGSVRMLSSSVSAYLTRGVGVALVAVPAGYVLLVWVSTRLAGRWRIGRAWQRAAVLAFVIAWSVLGQWTYRAEWATHYDWRIADNAPWVLASSWLRTARGERAVRMSEHFTPDDLSDFEPIGQRQPSVARPPASQARRANGLQAFGERLARRPRPAARSTPPPHDNQIVME